MLRDATCTGGLGRRAGYRSLPSGSPGPPGTAAGRMAGRLRLTTTTAAPTAERVRGRSCLNAGPGGSGSGPGSADATGPTVGGRPLAAGGPGPVIYGPGAKGPRRGPGFKLITHWQCASEMLCRPALRAEWNRPAWLVPARARAEGGQQYVRVCLRTFELRCVSLPISTSFSLSLSLARSLRSGNQIVDAGATGLAGALPGSRAPGGLCLK